MAPEQERNRAVRIAYSHARRGDDTAAARWLEVAAMFAKPTDRQTAHTARLLREAGPALIPGQLELAMARAQRAQADARGYRPAELRYG